MIQLIDEHRREPADLCRRFRVQRPDLFGSAVKGTFRPDDSEIIWSIVHNDLPLLEQQLETALT